MSDVYGGSWHKDDCPSRYSRGLSTACTCKDATVDEVLRSKGYTKVEPPQEMKSFRDIKQAMSGLQESLAILNRKLDELGLSLGAINTNLCTVAQAQEVLLAAIHEGSGALNLALSKLDGLLAGQVAASEEANRKLSAIGMRQAGEKVAEEMAMQAKLIEAYNRGFHAGAATKHKNRAKKRKA